MQIRVKNVCSSSIVCQDHQLVTATGAKGQTNAHLRVVCLSWSERQSCCIMFHKDISGVSPPRADLDVACVHMLSILCSTDALTQLTTECCSDLSAQLNEEMSVDRQSNRLITSSHSHITWSHGVTAAPPTHRVHYEPYRRLQIHWSIDWLIM